MMTLIKTFFEHPRKRYIYAVVGGKYLGELLVYIKSDNDNYWFLSLPLMKNRAIPIEKFKFGLEEKIVEGVEKIPLKVDRVCRAQFNKNVDDANIAA